MGKAHQGIAAQMKSELEEPLAAFGGGLKERRKIVQSGIEKLLKIKVQQTNSVNKVCTRRPSFRWPGLKLCLVARSLRTRLLENKRISGTGSHGHGPGREEEQSQAGKDADTSVSDE